MQLHKSEVLAIDSRIKSCIVENPDTVSDKYYCKVFFSYMLDGVFRADGRHEFSSTCKDNLLQQISDFINKPHHFKLCANS